MEISTFFGVPAHPLFVHLPVVLTPLAALTAVLLFRTSWRKPVAWIVVLLTAGALAGAQLAVGSGEALEEQVGKSRSLEIHTNLGDETRTFIAVFFALALILAAYDFMRTRRGATSSATQSPAPATRRIATAMTAAVILSGALATVWVVRTGHQGAKVTWEDVTR